MKIKKKFATALIFATAFTGLIAGTRNEAYAFYTIKDGVLEGDEFGPFKSRKEAAEAAYNALEKDANKESYILSAFLGKWYYRLIVPVDKLEQPLKFDNEEDNKLYATRNKYLPKINSFSNLTSEEAKKYIDEINGTDTESYMKKLVSEAQKLNNSRNKGKKVVKNIKKEENKRKPLSKEEQIEELKKSIEANKTAKKSAENLIAIAPKTVAPVRDKLDNLIKKADDIIKRSEAVLEKIKL
ncbi:GA module-containing protein [Anaerococcus lactolyticus]|uniref:Protein G-related albumin-binding (GA) module domain-containing protein n=1 Tax=Anaerococcus lactolyticus S7-1-13 TaxID=1284686 RepID=A0A095X4U5_9FIRM|nr:GA module-containing protein [Anaerococcus lactolyticus]KGF04828.1 hypothetical protein HMPREF1630_02065 [Anaerococcus lactolyticus S7-1-13]